MDDSRIIEDIYRITDEWEWVPMRIPPFDRFDNYDVDMDDIVELIRGMQRHYMFEVTAYPECVADVIDMIQHRPLRRLHPQTVIHYEPFVPLRPSLYRRVINTLMRFLPVLAIAACSNEDMDNGLRTTDNGRMTTDNGQRTTGSVPAVILQPWEPDSGTFEWEN